MRKCEYRVTQPLLAEPHAKHRLETLDAFRGIAIVAVILYHYTYRWGPYWTEWGKQWPHGRDFYGFDVDHAWFQLGNYGVEFFFIISGFVIFLTLERCSAWLDFAIRRFSRLYPTYWVCMLITYFAIHWFGNPDFERSPFELAMGFTMLSDQFGVGFVDGAYWSLVMELIFYGWVGLIYFNFRNRFVPAWICFCLLASLFSYFEPHYGRHIFAARYLCYFTAGIAFYSVYARHPIRHSAALFATALGLYLSFFNMHGLGEHLVVAAMVALFVLFVSGKLEWLGRGPLRFIGLVSYPLYLLHQYLGVSLIEILNKSPLLNGWPSIVLTSVAAIGAATVVHYAIELPSQTFVREALEGWRKRRTLQTVREAA